MMSKLFRFIDQHEAGFSIKEICTHKGLKLFTVHVLIKESKMEAAMAYPYMKNHLRGHLRHLRGQGHPARLVFTSSSLIRSFLILSDTLLGLPDGIWWRSKPLFLPTLNFVINSWRVSSFNPFWVQISLLLEPALCRSMTIWKHNIRRKCNRRGNDTRSSTFLG